VKIRYVKDDRTKNKVTLGEEYDVLDTLYYVYVVLSDIGLITVIPKECCEIIKEDDNMSKEYTFSEMIKEYENGYTGQFKDTSTSYRVEYVHDCLYWIDKDNKEDSVISISSMNFRLKFTKIDKEVPVHEAIKALKEGKKIYNIVDGLTSEYSNTKPDLLFNVKELISAKWYIRE
jgi:hypothetical protein